MAAALSFTLEDNIKDVINLLDFAAKSALIRATRLTINKTIQRTEPILKNRIMRQRKITVGVLKNILVRKKATGNIIVKMKGSLTVEQSKVPLIRFKVGRKTALKQRGKSLEQRRQKLVEVEIVPGRKRTLKHAFLAKARKKGPPVQIFRRRFAKGRRTRVLSVPNFRVIVARPRIRNPISKFIKGFLSTEFKRVYPLLLAGKIPSGKTKKRLI